MKDLQIRSGKSQAKQTKSRNFPPEKTGGPYATPLSYLSSELSF